MEFLVHIEVHWPPDGDEQKKNQLIKAETLRASELHAALSSLPFYPWLEIQVTPLAVHPSDPGWPVSGIKS